MSYDIVRKVLKDKSRYRETKLKEILYWDLTKTSEISYTCKWTIVWQITLVILFELPNNCYRVTDYSGEIVDMTEDEIIRYGNRGYSKW